MPFTQNPLQWKNLILSIKGKVQEGVLQYLQQQLGDWCNQASLLFQQLQSAPFLAGILGGSALFPTEAANTLIGNNTGSAAKPIALTTTQVLTMLNLLTVSTDLGTVTTNQSVACDNAGFVIIRMGISTAVNLTLTMTHLVVGAEVTIRFNNGAGTAQTIKFAGTNPSGTAYAIAAMASGDGLNDMVATGISVPAGATRIWKGNSVVVAAVPSLQMLVL